MGKHSAGFYPQNIPGLGGLSTGPTGPSTYPAGNSHIPRHATAYDPQADITKSLPASKKVNGKVIPVAATYNPKHSSRNFTPAQQMRAKIAASRGAVYNPANPSPVNLNAQGTKMGVYTNAPRQKQQNKNNLNSHQFSLHTAHQIYEKVIRPHEGKNKARLEEIAKNASR